ncbi:FAD/NAD(P)-binding domain-containing protein [Basidiobolus meristosporus CBS 931.73]|uniref:Amine oxidase n=1 Tax=Basidiobolus meristosporus CBS 931.73 TaxID=1314790 RepID=A0A1Y1XXR1_9FUNG|nr:FAD/NAD(P)-binding domain-containing protein [Basidiobolus meristosporus CBS 931.73]|eukprot:ORX90537.1 FAD/NAD(P)-binding domain-containing protein [Basidiobolus meristosporus CBS 931.73]
MASPKTVDVVVIGAGLSGLRAALHIQAAGLSYAVIEAIDRVGGKTLTVASKKRGPGVNDVGAAWINDTTQSEMFKLVQKYGLQVEIQAHKGQAILQSPEGCILFTHGEQPVGEDEQAVLSQVFAHFQELISNVNLEDPISSPNAKELDSVTLHEYCVQTFQSKLIADLLDAINQSLIGIEGKDISLLSFLHSCKTGTGLAAMISDGKDGGQYLRVRQGTQTFSQKMAAELKPDSLYLSTPVTEIKQDPGTGTCTVYTAHGTTFQAKKVILSIATPLYKTVTFTPPLPEDKQRLARENILGYYSKIIFVFAEPFWQTAGLTGHIQSKVGPFLFAMDNSFPDDEQWSISCFTVGRRGREWSLLSQDERRRTAWVQLCSAFENANLPSGEKIQVPEPINVLEYEWTKQEFFLGGPLAASPPGVLSQVSGNALRVPFGNIHFVGTETSLQWKGYMEGAVRSGDRGAKEVVEALTKFRCS